MDRKWGCDYCGTEPYAIRIDRHTAKIEMLCKQHAAYYNADQQDENGIYLSAALVKYLHTHQEKPVIALDVGELVTKILEPPKKNH